MATPTLTQDDFLAWVKEGPMAAANNEKIEITDTTVLSEVLDDKVVQGIAQKLTKWFLKKAGVKVPQKWPTEWLTWNPVQVAKYFVPIMLLLISTVTRAQLVIDLGTIKTADKNTAINIGISYFKSLSDSAWRNKDLDFIGDHSIFSLDPEFNIRFGTQDAFSSIQAKLVGSFMSFKTTDFRGFKSPDFTKPIMVFPVAIGVESNASFTTYNGIGEIGFTPFYQSETSSLPDVLRHSKFGVWLQGGYKFRGDSASTILTGGAKDQSAEKYNNGIMRLKGSLSVDTKSLVKAQGLNVGLAGNADVWYDVLHSKFYHKLDFIGDFYLNNGSTIRLIYSKGAGAPTFNQNDQYGLGFKFQL